MFAIVILARRSLRIKLINHRLDLAKFSTEFRRTFASVFVYAVDAHSAVLTHVICTIVDVFSAIFSSKSSNAIAGVVGVVVDALAAIHAGVRLRRTKLNFCLAKLAKEAPWTGATVTSNSVNTGCIIEALVSVTFV